MEAMFILGAVTMGIGAIVLAVRLRKTKNPARVARALAVISLICGIIHIVCQFLHPGQGHYHFGNLLSVSTNDIAQLAGQVDQSVMTVVG